LEEEPIDKLFCEPRIKTITLETGAPYITQTIQLSVLESLVYLVEMFCTLFCELNENFITYWMNEDGENVAFSFLNLSFRHACFISRGCSSFYIF